MPVDVGVLGGRVFRGTGDVGRGFQRRRGRGWLRARCTCRAQREKVIRQKGKRKPSRELKMVTFSSSGLTVVKTKKSSFCRSGGNHVKKEIILHL